MIMLIMFKQAYAYCVVVKGGNGVVGGSIEEEMMCLFAVLEINLIIALI